MKVVINNSDGGFRVSSAAVVRMRELGSEAARNEVLAGEKREDGSVVNVHGYYNAYSLRGIARHDPILVQVIEELGEAANGLLASLHIVEIPDGVDYEICDHDGVEHVAEKHRTWR